MNRKQTTSEVAPEIGITHQGLITYLARHPELKPAERLPNGDYLWDESEIQRVIDFRAKKAVKQPK
jgi:hypothetical protein